MRREPQAVFAAHDLDPRRRELYVEGRRDRMFLLHLAGPERDPDTLVLEADTLLLPGGPGGQRGRLLRFAEMAHGTGYPIRFFADADSDRVFGAITPSNVWLTDYRDLEGYILNEPCLEKVFRLGLHREDLDASSVLAQVQRIGIQIGALRWLSEKNRVGLPFQETPLSNHLKVRRTDIVFDNRAYLQNLLQNASRSLREMDDWLARWEEAARRLRSVPTTELIHGHDAVSILSEFLLREEKVARNDCERLLWTSFEAGMATGHPTLHETVMWIRGNVQQ